MSDAEINFPPPGFEQEVVYLECKRNHAASLNRVCYDGCQEFLKASVESNTKDAMLCDVCGCHQNFHLQHTMYTPKAQSQTRNTPNIVSSLVGPSDPHVEFRVSAENNPENEMIVMLPKPKRKKRTTFTVHLRNRMTEFANRIGWTPKGTKREEIDNFCLDIGISYTTFLVWLNNHRPRAMKKNTEMAN
ncbi:zinc-finger homeodomain protein 4-like [Lotus japonicus]|uniref:zinc-finger homeodomain protein 4-like n=1 Tax=Lotus japonicus TaxID=34305 RepID=UPI002590A439|nr:zinc-finger homeodomain protein 4-like [Lotus japonicus]